MKNKCQSIKNQLCATYPTENRTFCGDTASLDSILSSKSLNDFVYIQHPRMEMVIYRRSIACNWEKLFDNLEPSQFPDFRILVGSFKVKKEVEKKLDEYEIIADENRKSLVNDICNLVGIFAKITQEEYVDVRLDRIEDDSCWKFHRDAVETRLLTTYYGPTTEWVNPLYSEQALKEQKKYEGPIEHLQINDVAIFRGNRCNNIHGVVHRSPPISGKGYVRSLLCLDIPSSASSKEYLF